MSNTIENQNRIKFLRGQAAQAAGNYFARLGRDEIAKEEYYQALDAYNSMTQTLPDFAEAQNQKEIVQARLDKLFEPSLILTKWLQHQFEPATAAGWVALEEILGLPAIRSVSREKAIQRAKPIDLGTNQIVFVIELKELTNEKIDEEIQVIMQFYPLDKSTYLPTNLKIIVEPEIGDPDEHFIQKRQPPHQIDWFYKRGEQFRVKMQLNGITVVENFVV